MIDAAGDELNARDAASAIDRPRTGLPDARAQTELP